MSEQRWTFLKMLLVALAASLILWGLGWLVLYFSIAKRTGGS